MIFANDTHPPDEEAPPPEDENPGVMVALGEDDPPLMGLGSDLTESSAQSLSMALLAFNGGRVRAVPQDLDDTSDIEFYISSGGGSVNDMLAVYDLMCLVKFNRDIATFGFGKIYSAAVPLLAAGTKGKRYMGRNARLMLHHCSSHTGGSHLDIQSNFDELKKVEELMVGVLVEHSNLSGDEIYEIMSRNTDKFFSAEDALEMGIVDEII
jgi:ATP-dependent Clp endopeptidase proteolytic subunit ClpP